MRIAVVAPVWGRLLTTRLFWTGMQRVRRHWAEHTVQVFAVGNEPGHEALTAEFGGQFVFCENRLGKKFNAGCIATLEWAADYVLVMGSDDLLSPDLAAQYLRLMEDGVSYAGVRGCFMLEPTSQRALFLKGHAGIGRLGEIIGAGRLLRGGVLERAGGRLWPDHIMHGCDFRMTLALRKLNVKPDVSLDGRVFPLYDIKGAGNIWKYDRVATHQPVVTHEDYSGLVARFSEDEQICIAGLEVANCPTCGHCRPW